MLSYSLSITNCKFIENTGGSKGSTLYLYGTDLDIGNSQFTKNTADLGGAIYVETTKLFGSIRFTDSTFNDNSAKNGGAMWINTVTPYIKNIICENNLAAYAGGCIYSQLTVNGEIIVGNNALCYGNNVATPLQTVEVQFERNTENGNELEIYPGESFKMNVLVKDLYNQTASSLMEPNMLIIRPTNIEDGTVSQNNLFDNRTILVSLQIFPSQISKEFSLSIIVTPDIEKIVKVKILPCPNSYILNKLDNGYICEYSPIAIILTSAILGFISLLIIFGAVLYAGIFITRKLLKLRKQERAEKEIERKFTDNEFIFESEFTPLISSNSINSGIDSSNTKEILNSQKKRQQYIIPISEINILKRVGEGAMGMIYHAKWNRTDVAIKQLKTDSNDEEFENEAMLMSSLRHPCIVSCYGVSLTTNGKYMVVEYMEHGSLEKAIYNSRIGREIMRFETKLKILIDITKGLIYLHSIKPHKIIHRDLKPGNILLDKIMNAKVGDFGLSKIVSNNSATMTSNVGTLLYMAPELLSDNHKGKSTKVDVYSFGVIMWELLYEILPFSNEIDNSTTVFQILMRVAKGHRPELLHAKSFSEKQIDEWIEHNFTKKHIENLGKSEIIGFLESYVQIMERCWAQDSSQRPEFIEIIDLLEELQSQCQKIDDLPRLIPLQSLHNFNNYQNSNSDTGTLH
ncbi:predicted protein [Naegleria gruberi]|uniref:non-specific serine/threonine protein kinase n=1 Tax=Naegleria gruberi TaxID=5762 RepID=D2V6W1_NAEGR|nr:uncharacterized protein NAEGRDRAFT_64576 [Naegleria gruberi]EFC47641.1 predicted protein [Naegleria gruberi]|eukprot:XP_002680385.1 predicted protein [Naegleria gruberi strain NEG-M]